MSVGHLPSDTITRIKAALTDANPCQLLDDVDLSWLDCEITLIMLRSAFAEAGLDHDRMTVGQMLETWDDVFGTDPS